MLQTAELVMPSLEVSEGSAKPPQVPAIRVRVRVNPSVLRCQHHHPGPLPYDVTMARPLCWRNN